MMHAVLNAALPLLLAATTDAAAAPTVHVDADTVRADENGTWVVPITIQNPLAFGVFGDSLLVDVTDLDPGVSRAPRQVTLPFTFFIRSAGTVGGGESKSVRVQSPASCERAKLVIRTYLHDGAKAVYAFRDSVPAEPGEPGASVPSSFLDVKGRKVEIVAVRASGATGSVPGVLLVPSENAHARTLLRAAARLAERGANVVAVSPPGYGQSAGPADLAGPATLAALEAALGKLAAMSGTDRSRLAIWGTGRGATAALLLAAQDPAVARVVAQDALYDLWAGSRGADAATAADIASEAGRDSAGWKARSPLTAPVAKKARLLLIQGAEPAAQAAAGRAYAARLPSAGVDTLFADSVSHRMARNPTRTAFDFLVPPQAPTGH